MPVNITKLPIRSDKLWTVSAIRAELPERYANNPFNRVITVFNREENKAIFVLLIII